MVTSLGCGVIDNFDAIAQGRTGIRQVNDRRISQDSLCIGAIPEDIYTALSEKYQSGSRPEILLKYCLDELLNSLKLRSFPTGTALIIATAKGNIAAIEGKCADGAAGEAGTEDEIISDLARNVSEKYGLSEDCLIISNACISGVSALVIGRRLIAAGNYRNVIVAGVDCQCRFITSGFASFKSLSKNVCRPYDAGRDGLNLGEACGAIFLTSEPGFAGDGTPIYLNGGSISDDANHISGPSRTGAELGMAIKDAMEEAGVREVSFLQMHGTGTAYNDEMESKAAWLSGLSDVPCQSLKPYFGHTMGASGVIESIMAVCQLRNGLFFGTKGYETQGTPYPLNISADHRNIEMRSCVKTASGFGGCNAAIVLGKTPHAAEFAHGHDHIIRKVTVADGRIRLMGDGESTDRTFFQGGPDYHTFIREACKSCGADSMKFYKMDNCCKLGYTAAEYLLNGIESGERETGMILCGFSGSMDSDMAHQAIIDRDGDGSASPAVFVYTLPNVLAGELSIRHHIKGENTFLYAAREFDPEQPIPENVKEYARLAADFGKLRYWIVGRVEYLKNRYFAYLELHENARH